ncbi:multiple epidermal growth factor-like domains protein 6 isoform X3 [Haliotis rubra]|uniref:multiple epidermal growth factor-like domains protein 6 isoform X3 n=1 Tax=Haliotis rubra TaxID=36100 RepID=UPI001EE609AC|nr:multiple epidermal growth factor-like domains protein 6 isoform X3 [Haliotis rubra]
MGDSLQVYFSLASTNCFHVYVLVTIYVCIISFSFIMTIFVILWVVGFVTIGAVPCHHTQHCSDCDRETGDCLTECDTGYYDPQCNSTCSRNCVNNTCMLSEHASDNCTEGCVPGYSGIGCHIPCDSPGGNCTACPGGCDGGYCQLGSSCVSGCVDSYYGTDCDTGSSCTSLLPRTCMPQQRILMHLSTLSLMKQGCTMCLLVRENQPTLAVLTMNLVQHSNTPRVLVPVDS